MRSGGGVPQDYSEAVRWYRKAAEQGNADSQNNLALMYEHGQGGPQDYVAAVAWYRKAADQGNAAAQHNLGHMYEDGKGVPQNYTQAHMWFNLAASKANGDQQKKSSDARESVAHKMTPQQIEEAQRLARQWKPSR